MTDSIKKNQSYTDQKLTYCFNLKIENKQTQKYPFAQGPYMRCDCRTSEMFSTLKQGSIHHFLHFRMPVPSQEYDSCYSFI